MEVNASGEMTFCNPGTLRVLEGLGIDRGDCDCFLPGDLLAILGGWDKERESALQREVSLAGRVFAETVHLIPRFGVARIYGHDITDRKRAEEALREAHDDLERRVRERTAELRSLIEASLDPLVTINREGKISGVSAATELVTGYARRSSSGRTLPTILPSRKGLDRDTSGSLPRNRSVIILSIFVTGTAASPRSSTMPLSTGMMRAR